MTQMNIRIDEALKKEGDKVLARYGLTPSMFVRAAWKYVADTGDIPSFLSDNQVDGNTDGAAITWAKNGAGLATKLAGLPNLLKSDITYAELRDLAYEDELERYEQAFEEGSS